MKNKINRRARSIATALTGVACILTLALTGCTSENADTTNENADNAISQSEAASHYQSEDTLESAEQTDEAESVAETAETEALAEPELETVRITLIAESGVGRARST